MKTWIAENQTMAIIIGILIVAGLIYLFTRLFRKSDGKTQVANIDPNAVNVQETISNPSGRVGHGLVGTATVAPRGTAHGTAPSGGRVSNTGAKH